jgi:hypothetical protein
MMLWIDNLDPGMIHRSSKEDSVLRVFGEQFLDKVLRFFAHGVPYVRVEFILALLDVLDDLLRELGVERQHT